MKSFQQFLEGDDYKGQHQAPGPEDGAPMHDVTANGVYPKDYYTHPHYYGAGEKYDSQTQAIIQGRRDKPNFGVIVHRAIPKGVKGEINQGDWVTPHRQYALDHGRSNLGVGKFKIISKRVRARDLFTDGNSIHEWGYHPQAPHPETETERKVKEARNTPEAIERRAVLQDRVNKLLGKDSK